MAIVKEFAEGTSVVITAKATISSGDAADLTYQWRRGGGVILTQSTGGTATLVTSIAGVYDVIVSHPNAASVTSSTFTFTYRTAEDILRISYNRAGISLNSDSSFANPTTIDWNIASKYYEFGPDQNNGFDSGKSGWWRIWALEKDVSLDITMRGSCAGSNGDSKSSVAEGGTGTLRRTFEKGQIYTFRPGDRRTDGNSYAGDPQGDDVQWNAPNPGRVFSGGGSNGGGCTYMMRGGTLMPVCGGGGGATSSGIVGGDGGGLNVAGANGSNNTQGGRAIGPGDNIEVQGYPQSGVRRMTRCSVNSSRTGLVCDKEISASVVQNNGGFAYNGGGAGGSGVEGGAAGYSNDSSGGGGSGWASGAVTVVKTQVGGNGDNRPDAPGNKKNGSILILKTGFIRYLTEVIHTTGVRRGLTPSLQVHNFGSYDAEIIPQNVGTHTGDYDGEKHYLVKFPTSFANSNYTLNFTYISRTQASLNMQWDISVKKIEKEANQFRVWFQRPDGDPRHVNEWHFDAY